VPLALGFDALQGRGLSSILSRLILTLASSWAYDNISKRD
jgi:hypothetical protein